MLRFLLKKKRKQFTIFIQKYKVFKTVLYNTSKNLNSGKPQSHLAANFNKGNHCINTMGATRATEEWDVLVFASCIFSVKLNRL